MKNQTSVQRMHTSYLAVNTFNFFKILPECRTVVIMLRFTLLDNFNKFRFSFYVSATECNGEDRPVIHFGKDAKFL